MSANFPRTGAERIAAERERQIDSEGYTPKNDDEHDGGQLALAAACYASPERLYVQREFAAGVSFVDPFPDHWPDSRPYNGNVLKDPTDKQAIRLLEKAGALIAAEIDRLLRKSRQVSSDPAKEKT